MVLFERARTLLKQADTKELYTYFGIFAGILCVAFGGLMYTHYSRVSWHTKRLKQLDAARKKTKRILADAQLVKAQQAEIDAILAQNKDFRIGQAYQSIVNSIGLRPKLIDQSVPTAGDAISGKTEVQITSTLRGLSMKEVTTFLMQIAQIPQLYTKDIAIKRTAGKQTVDVDITVATLEPTSP